MVGDITDDVSTPKKHKCPAELTHGSDSMCSDAVLTDVETRVFQCVWTSSWSLRFLGGVLTVLRAGFASLVLNRRDGLREEKLAVGSTISGAYIYAEQTLPHLSIVPCNRSWFPRQDNTRSSRECP